MAKIDSLPVVVTRRPEQYDLRVDQFQRARESGIAMAMERRNAIAEGVGVSSDLLIQLIQGIKRNTDIEILLHTLGLGFHGENFDLTAGTPRQIIQQSKTPRGYIILNPNEVTGFSQTVTYLASLLRVPAAYTSTSFNVSGVGRAMLWLDVTANAGGGTLTVDAQTQDPLTGNWATSQADIFSGSAAIGTYYANIGNLGVDQNIRVLATVGVANVTFSVSGMFKDGATQTGANIFLGSSADVNATSGYPLLPGAKEPLFLMDNVPVFAITITNPMTIKVLYMQGAESIQP